jgi:formylglycine-generating enzyme required for sulfatase activity
LDDYLKQQFPDLSDVERAGFKRYISQQRATKSNIPLNHVLELYIAAQRYSDDRSEENRLAFNNELKESIRAERDAKIRRRLTAVATVAALIPLLFVGLITVALSRTEEMMTAAMPSPQPGQVCPDGMVYIAEGEFIMGAPPNTQEAQPDNTPQMTVYLNAFCIDRTEVSGARFSDFSDSHPYIFPTSVYATPFKRDTLPVVNITQYNAATYCRWRGEQIGVQMDLPSEAQWERTARGTNGNRYPWGAEWDSARANSGQSAVQALADVEAFASGASPDGVLNMAGNAAEWTRDFYFDTWYEIMDKTNGNTSPPTFSPSGTVIIRGGSFADSPELLLTTRRNGQYRPDERYDFIGFRCVAETLANP